MYYVGEGVKQDYAKAKKLFEQASVSAIRERNSISA